MHQWEERELDRAEGRAEGRAELLRSGIKNGLTDEQLLSLLVGFMDKKIAKEYLADLKKQISEEKQ